MGLVVLDATGTEQTMSTTPDSTGGELVGSTCVTDPSSGAKQNVGTAHLSDAQTLTGINSALDTSVPVLYNGVNYDRARGNGDAQSTLININATTAQTLTSADQTNHNHRGVQLGINVSAITGGAALVVTIQGKDIVSSQYYTLLATVSISATGFTLLTVYPGVASSANVSMPQVLPRTWNVKAVITGSGTVTATIGASSIV